MFDRFVKHYARINPQRIPEDSRALRASVLASIVIAEITILAMGYYSTINVILVPALTVAGFYVSWRRRRLRNLGLKFILSLLVIAATIFFMRELVGSLYDTRLPLIKLFLWLQVLHSFDVPARRDLKFSLGSGLTLIAAGAVLATGMMYLAGLALFSAAAAVSLVYFNLSEQSARAVLSLPARTRSMVVFGAVVWMAGLAAAIPIFLLLPQGTQARLHSLPISDLHRIFGDFSGGVANPGYSNEGNPFVGPPQYNPDSYYGFNQYMDLRSRGNLSDDIVMKVRSDDYNYYRGLVFDVYNGMGWEIGDDRTVEVQSDTQPMDLNLPDYAFFRSRSQVESFYIEADLPNIIFASWRPVSLYFPADRIKIDSFASLRSPYQLTEGSVYSVVTEQPTYFPETLRKYPRQNDPEPAGDFLTLPWNDDLARVKSLATEVTRDYANRYDQVVALERYLKDNYRYDLGIAPQTSGSDSVAYFLFEEKAGYCEHFASAMTVMARSLGIPARVVTGYAGGSYNPFTGLWEVKQSDAHAWVEVYFGSMGWVSFDPTPGFETPSPGDEQRSSWIAGSLFSYLGDVLGSGPVGRVLGSVGGSAGAVMGAVKDLPLLLMAALGLGFTALAFLLKKTFRALTRKRRLQRQVAATLADDYLSQGTLKEYFGVVTRLYQQGIWRRPDETLRQFAARASRFLGAHEFEDLSGMVEVVRYQQPDAESTGESWNARARELSQTVLKRMDLATESTSADRRQ